MTERARTVTRPAGRRVQHVVRLTAGMVAIFGLLGACAAQQPPATPPSSSSSPDATASAEPTAYAGPLADLLLPRPDGTEPYGDLKVGDLTIEEVSQYYVPPSEHLAFLRQASVDRAAGNAWRVLEPARNVIIEIYQFKSTARARAYIEEAERYDLGTSTGTFGSIEHSALVVEEASAERAHRFTFYAAHSYFAVAVTVFDFDLIDQDSAMELAIAQYELLP